MHPEQDRHLTITHSPVGVIRSPFQDIAGMPIQPNGARGTRGTIEVFPSYAGGLRDIGGFERLILIYALHKCTGHQLVVKPFLDPTPRGIFATRSPRRPNAIGLSVVRLISVDGATLTIEDVDVLDGTPVLDIKPYVPAFDAYPGSRCGWFENIACNAETTRSDDRFR
jgi:tRNA-Thr(GGU) m(6)t(6)A37 methyltransferase TsaA